MKIVICISEEKNGEKISKIFSESDYFLIFDTEQKKITEKIKNTFNSSAGSEIFCAQYLVNQDINAIACMECEDNAAKIFSEAKIDIIKTKTSDINLFLKNLIKEKGYFHVACNFY